MSRTNGAMISLWVGRKTGLDPFQFWQQLGRDRLLEDIVGRAFIPDFDQNATFDQIHQVAA